MCRLFSPKDLIALTYPTKLRENVIRDVSEKVHTLEVTKCIKKGKHTKDPRWAMHTFPSTVHTVFLCMRKCRKNLQVLLVWESYTGLAWYFLNLEKYYVQ